MKLTFVTSNDDKAREAEGILGLPVERVKLDLDEIQSMDLRKVVEHKVRQAYAKLGFSAGEGHAVIVEDVSFAIKQLNGLPGTFIKWFENGIGSQGIADMLAKSDRSVSYIVGYGFFDGEKFLYTEGVLDGLIAKEPRGAEGFGFDTIFIPSGYEKTMSELGVAVKIKIGPRTLALLSLKDLLLRDKSYKL
jgi:non-canonical purine NTP pyrophosphatase (RdgB/HAM1 family)